MRKDWLIEQNSFAGGKEAGLMESLFTMGNGFLGLRGDFPLCGSSLEKGTYINGFYESGPIRYGEKAYGYADNWQTIVPLPDSKNLHIEVDGIGLFDSSGQFRQRKRVLDLEKSRTEWDVLWTDVQGKQYSARVTVIVPFRFRGIVLYRWKITLPETGKQVKITGSLQMERKSKEETDDPRLPGHFDGASIGISVMRSPGGKPLLALRTGGSRLSAFAALNHTVNGLDNREKTVISDDRSIEEIISGTSTGELEIIKYTAYNYGSNENENHIVDGLLEELRLAESSGYRELIEHQDRFMEEFWKNSRVEMSGDDEALLSLRFNLFQLLQSTGRDGKRSIAAKGLSGSGYEGHYFWDAETYVLPFFIYTNPEIARSMLSYRISIMDRAEKRARIMNHKGLLFPWRTINGDECSAYFPAGTAQFHINSDIALGLTRYLEVTGDTTILDDGGDRLLEGTASFWEDLGCMVEGRGFCFNEVTGPDEYTALVDNNYYTNLSARENLKAAGKWLKGRASDEVCRRWNELADKIFLPSNGSVTPQNDGFLEREVWDFEGTPEDSYPLLLHYHPLNIYRKQVLKQADVVMAQVLFPWELPAEQKKINFDYYEQITTRDSSLSACAQGINAFRLGYVSLAEEYFRETLHTDRKDLHGNVSHGLHTASMGGSYLMVLYGFLGMEIRGGEVSFHPGLPDMLTRLALTLTFGKAVLDVVLEHGEACYSLSGGELEFRHESETLSIKAGNSIRRPFAPQNRKDFKLFRPRT